MADVERPRWLEWNGRPASDRDRAWRKDIQALGATAVQAAEEQTVAPPGEATTAVLVKQPARRGPPLGAEFLVAVASDVQSAFGNPGRLEAYAGPVPG